METCHEDAYRCSRLGHADCGADVHSARERGPDVPGELVIRLQRLLIERTESDHKSEMADRIVVCEAAGHEPAAPAMGKRPRWQWGSSVALHRAIMNKPSAAERCRIEFETERRRERRAA
jgi:hypothetical protein